MYLPIVSLIAKCTVYVLLEIKAVVTIGLAPCTAHTFSATFSVSSEKLKVKVTHSRVVCRNALNKNISNDLFPDFFF
jgi:hypothetical protein